MFALGSQCFTPSPTRKKINKSYHYFGRSIPEISIPGIADDNDLNSPPILFSMMRFGSGTYNVRDSEVMRESPRLSHRTLICTVHFLDGSSEEFEVDRHAKGQDLLDKVYAHLELIEKDYFGLQFADLCPDPDNMVKSLVFVGNCLASLKKKYFA